MLSIPPVLLARHWRGFERATESGRLRRKDPRLKVPAVHRSGEIVPMRGSSRSSPAPTAGPTERW
jgi:hypothetical protein